jgi:hypothetical protein
MMKVTILLKKKRFILAKLIVQNNVSDTCNSDHDILSVVRVNHALDSTTHFQQEGSELIKKKKSLLVQHNLDAFFNNQYVCVTHHENSTNQPQHDTDLCSSRRKQPALRSDFLWVQTEDILHQKVLTQIFSICNSSKH